MERTVLYEVEGSVALITLNRPGALNTMSPELLAEAHAAMQEAASDDAVRAVVLTGAGRGFCAGGDLQGMSARDNAARDNAARDNAARDNAARDNAAPDNAAPAANVAPVGTAAAGSPTDALADHAAPRPKRTVEGDIANLRQHMRTSQLLHTMPKVTFAAINGPCAGAGLSWACATDIRYCAESAVFNTAFMTAGLSGDFGGTWTLPRIVGPGKARELYLLAEKFGSADAARIGLVSGVLPDDQLLDFVRGKAERAAGFAPLTMRSIKANLNDSLDVDFCTQLDREADRHVRAGRTEDSKEAARAFLEKRPPVFKGR